MKTEFNQIAAQLTSVAIGIIPVFILISYFDVSRKLIIGWGEEGLRTYIKQFQMQRVVVMR